MKRLFALLAVAALAATNVSAHPNHEKCTLDPQTCLNTMAAKLKDAPWAGLRLGKDDKGAYANVLVVEPGSPAEKAGIRPGDVLVAIDGATVESHEAMKQVKERLKPGSTASYTIRRGERSMDLAVTLAAMPDIAIAQNIGFHMLEAHVTSTEAASMTKPAEAKK